MAVDTQGAVLYCQKMLSETDGRQSTSGKSELSRKNELVISLCVALAATAIFYLRAIISKSLNAGFVFTGDFWGFFVGSFSQTSNYLSHGVFSGIDLSTHGGAGEFFLRPNLAGYHPLILLYCFLFHPYGAGQLVRPSVILLVVHSFAACYFALRLAVRYLKLSWGIGIFIALGYAFSVHMAWSVTQPMFVFCTSMLPWAIYGGLATSDAPTLKRAILYSLPMFVMLTGGYITLGVSCILLAWGFIAVYIFYIQGSAAGAREGIRRLAAATAPFAIAGVVVAPLYWAIIQFHALAPSYGVPLEWSAHMLAEMPRTVLRLISSRIYIAGPMYEFEISCGAIPVTVMIMFFLGARDKAGLSDGDWRLLRTCFTVYTVMVLAIYGGYSAISDLLYFVPGIGQMHIYQRHLLAGQLFFYGAVGVMLKSVTRQTSTLSAKGAFGSLLVLLVLSTHYVAIDNGQITKNVRIDDHIVFELLLGMIFVSALLLRNSDYAVIVAAVVVFLVPLRYMYDYSEAGANVKRRGGLIAMDQMNNDKMIAYFKSHSHKAITKYLDLTPGLFEYITKNYPWFVARDVQLASYGGYEFSNAARADYLRRMETTLVAGESRHIMLPDWEWVARTGADFVIYEDGYRNNDGHLPAVADLGDAANVLRLPGNIVIAPLKLGGLLAAPDFGDTPVSGRYVRIQLGTSEFLSLAEVRVMSRQGGVLVNVAERKPATQSSLFSTGYAAKAVDGNINGDFKDGGGSVTHTMDTEASSKQGLHQTNAWWEVDLGTSVPIDSIEIWNRTDGSSGRLRDYWVFVSDKPFAKSDTPSVLKDRPGIRSNHQLAAPAPSVKILGVPGKVAAGTTLFDNGYLRVIGTTGGATASGFRTDGATALDLDVEASQPVKVQYLFWPNERLKYSLSGQSVDPTIEDGLQTVNVPPGHAHLEIRYVNWPQRVFLLLYVIYALSVSAVLVITVIPGARWLVGALRDVRTAWAR
jgi:hypothetical protein